MGEPSSTSDKVKAVQFAPMPSTDSSEQRTVSTDGTPGIPDLGFGTRYSEQAQRLMNPDGSFNIERRGLPLNETLSAYHTLLTISWWKFNALVVAAYLVINLLFASFYMLAGVEHLQGISKPTFFGQFLESFYFSTQTFTTVGYGRINPIGDGPSLIASIESMVGLLTFAIATGLIYGRFSRPHARLLFSDKAVVGPYKDITGFMFRVANKRVNQLLDVEAMIALSMYKLTDGVPRRVFFELELERKLVQFFHLSWTVVHPITKESPIYGMTFADLEEADAEFLVLMQGFDETFSQVVHTRRSYKWYELAVGFKFSSIIDRENGKTTIDLHRLSEMERVS